MNQYANGNRSRSNIIGHNNNNIDEGHHHRHYLQQQHRPFSGSISIQWQSLEWASCSSRQPLQFHYLKELLLLLLLVWLCSWLLIGSWSFESIVMIEIGVTAFSHGVPPTPSPQPSPIWTFDKRKCQQLSMWGGNLNIALVYHILFFVVSVALQLL